MSQKKVIVVGAGIAGLSAAWELQKAGYQVEVLEKADQVGGRISSQNVDGFVWERGAQIFLSGYSNVILLLREFKMVSDIRRLKSELTIASHGRFYHYADHFRSFLQRPGLFGWWDALKVLAFRLRFREALFRRSISDLLLWHDFDRVSFACILRSWLTPKFVNCLIEPQVLGFFADRIDSVSSALGMILSSFTVRGLHNFTLRGGLQQLPLTMARSLNVKLSHVVEKVEATAHGVVVQIQGQSPLSVDYVILAVPAPLARKIFVGPSEIEQKAMTVEYGEFVIRGATVQSQVPLPAEFCQSYGIFVETSRDRVFTMLAHETNTHDIEELEKTQGSGVARREMPPEGDCFFVQTIDDNRFGEHTIVQSSSALCDLLGLDSKSVKIEWHEARWPLGTCLVRPGRIDILKNYYDSLSKQNRIFLAGDYMGVPLVEGAVLSGQRSAAKLIEIHS